MLWLKHLQQNLQQRNRWLQKYPLARKKAHVLLITLLCPSLSGSFLAAFDTAGVTEGGLALATINAVLQPTVVASLLAVALSIDHERDAPLCLLRSATLVTMASALCLLMVYSGLYLTESPHLYDVRYWCNTAYYTLTLLGVALYRLVFWGD